MIVEPSSLRPRSRFRRLLRTAGFMAPAVLLAAVAAAGMAGPKPTPSAPPSDSAAADAPPASNRPAASPAAASAPSDLTFGTTPFPASYLTLPTMHPSEVLTARSSPTGAPLVLSVVGYLGDVRTVSGCPQARAAAGAWCERRAVLADAPFGAPGSVGGFSPHLHVLIPPGVAMPVTLASGVGRGDGWTPVEALGRFSVPGQCDGGGPPCEQGFVVERIVWVDGWSAPVIPLREPGISARTPAAPASFSESPTLLLAVLVRPSAIAALDPSAASAAARLRPRGGLVWYVRELGDLDADGPDEPVIRWAIIDAAGGGPVAGGPSVLPTVVGTPAPSLVTGP